MRQRRDRHVTRHPTSAITPAQRAHNTHWYARVVACCLILGCGGGGETPITPPPPAPSLSISASPASLTLVRGAATQSTITLVRSNLQGAIELSVEDVPNGVTASLGLTSVPSGTASTVVTLTATSTAALGSFSMRVRARATGVSEQVATLSITVVGPPSIAVSATAATITRGTVGSLSVSVARANFTGAVSLSIAGLPAGATAAAVANTSDGAVSIPISVNASTSNGVSNVTVTASAAGVPNATASTAVTVAPITGTVIQYAACGLGPSPAAWVAAQDGDGPWTQLVASAEGIYAFGASSRSALTVVSPQSATAFSTALFYGTSADFQHLATQPCPSQGSRTIAGTMSGIASGQVAQVRVASAFVNVPTNGAFSLTALPTGLVDLVATRRLTSAIVPNAMILRAGVDPAAGANLSELNFEGSEAFAPVNRTITLAGLSGGESVGPFVQLQTARGTTVPLFVPPASVATSVIHPAVPLARLAAGDVQIVTLNASDNVAINGARRSIYTVFRSPDNQTLTFGEILNAATVSAATSTPARLRAQFTRPSTYMDAASVSYNQSIGNAFRSIVAQFSSGYLGAASAFDYTLPSFDGVSGWNSTWWIQSGAAVNYSAGATSWGGASTVGFFPATVDGLTIRGATRVGVITP